MARQVAQIGLGIVGAVIGAPFGMAGLGFAVGSSIGGMLVPQQLPSVEGPRIADLVLSTSSYGTPIPVVYGRIRLGSEIIYSTDRRERKHTKTVRGGKGSSKQTQTTYTYDIDIAYRLCEGEISAVTKLWAYGKLMADQASTASIATRTASMQQMTAVLNAFMEGKGLGQKPGRAGVRLYLGDETQLPDPTIEAGVGSGNVPAWRGHAYLMFTTLQLADFGNNPPPISAVVETDTSLALTSHGSFTQQGLNNAGIFLDGIEIWRGTCTGIIDANGEALFYRIRKPSLNTPYDPVSAPFGYHNIPGDSFGLQIYTEFAGSGARLEQRRVIVPEYMALPTTGIPSPQQCNFSPEGRMMWAAKTTEFGDSIHFGDWNRGIYKILPTPIVSFSPLAGYLVLAYIGDYLYLSVVKTSGGAESAIVRYHIGTQEQTVLKSLPGESFASKHVAGGNGSVFAIYNRVTHDLEEWPNGEDSSTVYSGAMPTVPNTTIWTNAAFADKLHRVGDIYYLVGAALHRYDTLTGESLNLGNTASPTVGYQSHFREGVARRSGSFGNASTWFTIGITSNTGPSLASVLTDICTRQTSDFTDPPLEVSDVDVSDAGLSALTVTGYAIARQTTRRAALNPLLTAYNIGTVESEGQIKFKTLDGGVDLVIDPDDLGAHPAGSQPPEPLQITQTDDKQLPLRVEVSYIDITRDYDESTQPAQRRRSVTSSDQVLSVELPVVMTSTQAKQLAEIILQRIWTQRTMYEFSVPVAYSEVEPLDVVSITYNGFTHTVQITEKDETGNVITFKGVSYSVAAFTSDAVAADPEQEITNQLKLPGPAVMELLDCNMLQNSDTDPGYYAAVTGLSDDFTGAVIYQASESGETLTEVTTVIGATSIGIATSALADCNDPMIFDRKNTLSVRLLNDAELSSAVDRAAVLDGSNGALLGSNAKGWEVIQYRDVVENATGTWTVSYLLRGRRGTEHLTGIHSIGDTFIALSTEGMAYIRAALAERDTPQEYYGVSIGAHIGTAERDEFTWTGRNLKPLSVHHVRGTRSGADLTAEWIARKRLNMSWRAQVPVPNDEAGFEQYEIDVMNGATVLNTYTVNDTTQWTYTTAEQTADGVPDPDNINLEIYRISGNVTGLRGYATEVTL